MKISLTDDFQRMHLIDKTAHIDFIFKNIFTMKLAFDWC